MTPELKEILDQKQELAQFDVAEVTKARVYLAPGVSKFGPVGLFEYFDKNQKLLGRFLQGIELMPCI